MVVFFKMRQEKSTGHLTLGDYSRITGTLKIKLILKQEEASSLLFYKIIKLIPE